MFGDRVQVLPPEVARKIAAGEVIDRPAALVRELVDNAIDAGAKNVEVSLQGGGAVRTEVSDDGRGMDREDLELCWLPHATSKIRTEDDLLRIETLGFRGEALSSVAAVARLEILSSRSGGKAWRLAVGPGGDLGSKVEAELSHRALGTSVRVLGLYDSFPARKKFLKRDSAEAALCRQAMLEKALAFPEVCFRFVSDGELKLFLPAVETRRERFAAAVLGRENMGFIHELFASGTSFSLSIVLGGPEITRADRKAQYVIVNGRRIQDFALLQALEYGTQGWFPNGSRPAGAIYVDMDPAEVDFNIHPAKREARFRDPSAVHRCAVVALKDFMHRLGIAQSGHAEPSALGTGEFVNGTPDFYSAPAYTFEPLGGPMRGHLEYGRQGDAPYPGFPVADSRSSYSASPSFGSASGYSQNGSGEKASRLAMEALLDSRPAFPPLSGLGAAQRSGMEVEAGSECRYLGTAFGLFLVVQRGERLYLIDQHAAHERILYDRLRVKAPQRQELLVPYPFETDSDEDDAFLEARKSELDALGIVVERDGLGTWQLTALPESWKSGDAETVRELLDLRSAGADLAERWYATMACHAAVKDGDTLDVGSAADLAREALELPVPRCPHGRPVWVEIGLKDLLRGVRRLE